jgi:hypothetical protein
VNVALRAVFQPEPRLKGLAGGSSVGEAEGWEAGAAGLWECAAAGDRVAGGELAAAAGSAPTAVYAAAAALAAGDERSANGV